MKLLLRVLGLIAFGAMMVALEVNAFPGPWVWNASQLLLVLVGVVIVGLAAFRATKPES
jgi:hypothetical protein